MTNPVKSCKPCNFHSKCTRILTTDCFMSCPIDFYYKCITVIKGIINGYFPLIIQTSFLKVVRYKLRIVRNKLAIARKKLSNNFFLWWKNYEM